MTWLRQHIKNLCRTSTITLGATIILSIVVAVWSIPPTAGATEPAIPDVSDVAVSLASIGGNSMPSLPVPPHVPPSHNDTSGTMNNASTTQFCDYESKIDDPHISANGTDISVHGHWIYHNGTCSTATVTIWLYHLRWNPFRGYYWAPNDSDKVRNMPSNPPIRGRANARHRCQTQDQLVSFYAIVDVDIDDHSDPSDTEDSQENLNCVPW